VLSSSGGGSSTASDRVTEVGLTLAPLGETTRRELEKMLLPPQAANPVDLGGGIVPGDVEIAGDATRILFADPAVDYGIGYLMSMPFYLKRTVAIGDAAQECGKPVVMVCTPGTAADPARQELQKHGWIVYDSFEQSLQVLALVAQYDRL